MKPQLDPKLKDILTIKEAAEIIGVHVQTVKHHYYASKRIRAKKVGNVLIFHRKEVEKFVRESLVLDNATKTK